MKTTLQLLFTALIAVVAKADTEWCDWYCGSQIGFTENGRNWICQWNGVFNGTTMTVSGDPNTVMIIGCHSATGDVTIPGSIDAQFRRVRIHNDKLEEETKTMTLNVIGIGSSVFAGDSITTIIIPTGVKTIGDSAFAGCRDLISVKMPESVVDIGKRAFEQCKSLQSLTFPSKVTSVSANMFNGCHSLTTVQLPEGVANIDHYAFNNCVSLNEITIPPNVVTIGSYAFFGCTSLTQH